MDETMLKKYDARQLIGAHGQRASRKVLTGGRIRPEQ
jgi:hypothetical protein